MRMRHYSPFHLAVLLDAKHGDYTIKHQIQKHGRVDQSPKSPGAAGTSNLNGFIFLFRFLAS
jgi:hypothetical protein